MATPDSLSLFRPIAIEATSHLATSEKVSVLGAAIARVRLWRNRYNGRRTIRAMTSEQIAELDLDRLALRQEGEKPFWRA